MVDQGRPPRVLLSTLAIALLPLLGFLFPGLALRAQEVTGRGSAPAEATDAYGDWAAKDPAEWPHITMLNQIDYTDVSHPVAACGFLIDTGDEILAATAKHVLLYFKSEAMDSVSFRGTLKAWRMFPKDDPSRIALLGELLNEDETEPLGERIPSDRDWLLFTVAQRPDGVQPLRLRSTPMRAGEPVYVVGWRYTDEGPQHVREGKYVRSERGTVLVSIPDLVGNTMPGLSGSPVIDARGYVIGLMSAGAAKLQRLSSVDYPRGLLDRRRED